jgi:glutathione S-transferase
MLRLKREMTMLTLYYAPGACSIAAHVALEEIGARYQARPISLADNEHLSEEYLRINPHGRVPALRTEDETILTENVAILPYIAKLADHQRLLPSDSLEEAKCLSFLGFLSTSVHGAYGHILRPWRYSGDDELVQRAVKQKALVTYEQYCKEIDDVLGDRLWFGGSAFTVCDPYAFVFYRWGKVQGLPMEKFAAWTSHTRRMLDRRSVRDVLVAEGIASPL